MDPLSVLSIAAAVVAFVDFGGKLLSSASRRLKRNDGLTAAFEDLEKEAGHLGRLGRRIESTHKQSSELFATQDPESDALLLEVARDCIAVSKDVENLVATLQTATKTYAGGGSEHEVTKKRIQRAEQSLASINGSIMSTVMACLWWVGTYSFVVLDRL